MANIEQDEIIAIRSKGQNFLTTVQDIFSPEFIKDFQDTIQSAIDNYHTITIERIK